VVVGNELFVENVERLFETMVRVATPMDGFLVDCHVDKVLDVFEDECLRSVGIAADELLHEAGSGHLLVYFFSHFARVFVEFQSVSQNSSIKRNLHLMFVNYFPGWIITGTVEPCCKGFFPEFSE
jgi:hypothetical protein